RRRGRRRAGRSPPPGPAPPPGSPWRHTIGGPPPGLKHGSIRDTMPPTGGPRGPGNRGEGGAGKRSLLGGGGRGGGEGSGGRRWGGGSCRRPPERSRTRGRPTARSGSRRTRFGSR